MSSTDLPIRVDALAKTYQEGIFRKKRVHALRGVSLTVPAGTAFGLLGPNGAGKTTLIKVLLGIVRKSGGRAALFGRAAGDRATRRRVGYLPENHRIPRHHTAYTALEYYGGLSGVTPRRVRQVRDYLLELVGLKGWGDSLVRKYSKGMLQRLGLAQALLHEPELLILDEPTDGVDPVGRSEIRGLLKVLRDEGKTIFINSHLLQEVQLVCDRVAILDRGKLLREGTIDELTVEPQMHVSLLVAGSEDALSAALANSEVVDRQPAGSGQVQLVVRAANQAAVDRCVDELRRRHVAILELSRRRQTLEDAFLNIVSGQPAGSVDVVPVEEVA